MSRIYTVEFENVTWATASGDIDIFEIQPVTNQPCAVHALYLAQISDVGDAQEEIARIRVIRGHTTIGSGGAVATPRPLDPGDAAAGFTADTNNTTVASLGTPVNLHSDAFNIRTGVPLILPPELRWWVTAAQTTLVVRLMAALADDVTASGTLYVQEIG